MFQLLLLMLVSIMFMGCPAHGGANDWVFKGQPKDGSEHYQSFSAEESNRAQRVKLVADCDKMMQLSASKGDVRFFSDPAMRRSTVLGLNSCGLVYGVDHQEEKASACLNRALELAESLGDSTEQARILNNFGIVYALWGQFAIALDYHRKSLSLSLGTSDDQNRAISYNQIGQISMFLGDYRKSSEAFERCLAEQAKTSDNNQSWLTLDNLGQLNEAWGNYEKALQCYQQALELKKKFGLTGGEVASDVLLGRVYGRLGKTEEALGSFLEGLKLCEKHGYPTDLVIDHIGNLYLDQGDTQRAEEYIKRDGFWQSFGRLCLMKGDLSAAERTYAKLLNYSESRRILDYLCVAHTGLGVVKEQKGDLQSAAKHFRKAIEHIESIRVSLTQQQRAEFFNVQIGGFLRTAPYKGLARVLVKMNKPAEAFRESEFTKARTFSEGLSRRLAKSTMSVPADAMALDDALTQQLAAVTRALHKAYEEYDHKAISVLDARVRTAKDKLAAHVDFMRVRYPLFASTRYPEPMGLDQAAVKDDEWVLAYDVTDSGIIIYLAKGNRIVKAIFKPVARAEIDCLVRKFREPFEMESGESLAEKLGTFDFAVGKRLSDILLHDVLAELPRDICLIVVPDDTLGVLPFEMLIINDGGKVVIDRGIPTTSGAEFFGDRNSISYYQSVTALTLARTLRKQQKSTKRILAMVDPIFSTDDSRFARITQQERKKLLARLPSDVLMSIRRNLGITFPRLPLTGKLGEDLKRTNPSMTDLYKGLQARKKVLLGKDLMEYGSVVLATHGYFGKALPGIQEPVLVLTLLGEQENEDGFLRLTEVMSLKMNPDVVALAACQTGLGRHISGEGTMGMGRAFQYAGARSVLMSMWSVSEESSVKLMESFFSHFKAGKSKLEAMRSARRDIRNAGYDHPFFWASFVLVGEVD
jgi:tetratricopeptide (TPR) repeat protein